MFCRVSWVRVSKSGKLRGMRSYCTKTSGNGKKPNKNIVSSMSNDSAESGMRRYSEDYQQLENLDLEKASKILFTDRPKKKKFGFDFHLVQFFFAGMPSLAVYLVAQYARYEMRKMEAELEEKKKQEEEKAKENEQLGPEGELSEVKVRLEKLEETVKEIVVETKKGKQEDAAGKGASFDPNKSQQTSSPAVASQANDQGTSNQAPAPISARNDQRHKNEDGGPSSSSDPKR